ncbi:hypothetical protein HWV62_22183 [Athelia sp. TMB]|nr:hypothetical protein HWV62_22183 [Athelia sp. TMB]
MVHLFTMRSGVCPLQIEIIVDTQRPGFWGEGRGALTPADEGRSQPLAEALGASSGRWQNFHLKGPRGFIKQMEQSLHQNRPWSLPLLAGLHIVDTSYSLGDISEWPVREKNNLPVDLFAVCPRLNRIGFESLDYDHDKPEVQFPRHQIERVDTFSGDVYSCRELLRLCSNLIRCDNLQIEWGDNGDGQPVRNNLQVLAIVFCDEDDEEDEGVNTFFECLELPFVLDLQIHFNWAHQWTLDTRTIFTSFLTQTSTLQRFVLRLNKMPSEVLRSILVALPGLRDFQLTIEEFGDNLLFSKELLEELTFSDNGYAPTLLPNLRALSLSGNIGVYTSAFSAMVRSRTKENKDGERGALLQSLHVHIVSDGSTSSTTLLDSEFAEVRNILGEQADIQITDKTPDGLMGPSAFMVALMSEMEGE